MAKAHLDRAQVAKNNEFYTQRVDIEKELQYFTEAFKDKVIYCNCDDYQSSEFVSYFRDNFKELGLKKLISTSYNPLGGTKMELTLTGALVTQLEGDGDFRSDECLERLRAIDMVITNPPFSLWKAFLQTLQTENKEFLVIGPTLPTSYTFGLLLSGRMRIGGAGIGMKFTTPDGSVKPVSVNWYTNLPDNRIREPLPLTESYSPERYPTYDNYDAIEVSRLKDLPKDYFGVMGVPITILGKYSPEQFELTGEIATSYGSRKNMPTINGEWKFLRVFIKRKQPKE